MEGAGHGHDAEKKHEQAVETRREGELVLFVAEFRYELESFLRQFNLLILNRHPIKHLYDDPASFFYRLTVVWLPLSYIH